MSESIQRPGYKSRVNLHHDAKPREKVVLEDVAIFFCCKNRAGFDGDRFNAVRLFARFQKIQPNEIHSMNLLNRFNAQDSTDSSLIEGAQWNSCGRVQKTEAQLFSAEQKDFVIPNEMVVRSLVAASQFPARTMKELLVVKVQSKVNYLSDFSGPWSRRPIFFTKAFYLSDFSVPRLRPPIFFCFIKAFVKHYRLAHLASLAAIRFVTKQWTTKNKKKGKEEKKRKRRRKKVPWKTTNCWWRSMCVWVHHYGYAGFKGCVCPHGGQRLRLVLTLLRTALTT